ncbi:hypothetical protein OG883_45825 [Streptomyces sp. NBC_01142]|uniref:hypothetical protein n=1 Tax=Streptomyces sp. NBC_01142 TaxID=2975865 RepID=UPI00225A3A2C|nr:hypothetical protein [Streptomyces sp. NBC_01142]MCX4826305.1 hypothetical protein [Streptomyces sp. NBC_01142]MCX4826960.1 hypothetical protein [Streptomyces sp. NBC_01142]
MTETTSTPTYTADAVAAGTSLYPHPKPLLDTGALAEAIRVQLRTWVPGAYGITIPTPETFAAAPTERTAGLLGEITGHIRFRGAEQDDASPWALAHLFKAHRDSLHADHGRGDAHLLGALYSLIVARAHVRDGSDGRFDLDPFGADRSAIDERSLIETIRVQLATWVSDTFGTIVPIPNRWEMRTAADLSDLIGAVMGAAETKYGDMDDDDSIQGMAHLANVRVHGLKAGYGHGDAHLFAALNSLILAAAALT